MFRFTMIVTFSTAVAAVAPVQAQEADKHSSTPREATGAASAALPPSVSPEILARISDFWAYGDRFEKAIRLIEAEASKPSWGWDDSCEPPDLGAATELQGKVTTEAILHEIAVSAVERSHFRDRQQHKLKSQWLHSLLK